jgi:hypothetical protein
MCLNEALTREDVRQPGPSTSAKVSRRC